MSNNTTPLTPEEKQFIRDMGNDDGFWRYPACSSPVTPSDLLQKVTDQFNEVPSYVERFANQSTDGASK